jgi:hypothetical protein
VVQWLLASGADPNPLDRHDRTPLEVSRLPPPGCRDAALRPCYGIAPPGGPPLARRNGISVPAPRPWRAPTNAAASACGRRALL